MLSTVTPPAPNVESSHALDRYGRQLLATEEVSVDFDNGTAWRMATESEASVAQLETAQRLAERAADRTDYANPEILDTLRQAHGINLERLLAVRDALKLDPDDLFVNRFLDKLFFQFVQCRVTEFGRMGGGVGLILSAFALEHHQRAAVAVQIVKLEIGNLHSVKASRVQHFQNGTVAHSEGIRLRRAPW